MSTVAQVILQVVEYVSVVSGDGVVSIAIVVLDVYSAMYIVAVDYDALVPPATFARHVNRPQTTYPHANCK